MSRLCTCFQLDRSGCMLSGKMQHQATVRNATNKRDSNEGHRKERGTARCGSYRRTGGEGTSRGEERSVESSPCIRLHILHHYNTRTRLLYISPRSYSAPDAGLQTCNQQRVMCVAKHSRSIGSSASCGSAGAGASSPSARSGSSPRISSICFSCRVASANGCSASSSLYGP